MTTHIPQAGKTILDSKDTNRKIRTTFSYITVFEFWFQIPFKRHTHCLLHVAHIASEFICVYSAAAGTIFGTKDVYELGFSYLSISIFTGLLAFFSKTDMRCIERNAEISALFICKLTWMEV